MMTQPTIKQLPWETLTPSPELDFLTMRLANPDADKEASRVFWARTWNGRPALLIEYDPSEQQSIDTPDFDHLQLYDNKREHHLFIELCNESMEDVFYQLSLDIIEHLAHTPAPLARNRSISRLQFWNAFLKTSKHRLSPEEQKGLIAELLFLSRVAMPTLGVAAALEGWTGPDDAPRDFGYGQVFIEVKSKRNPSSPHVRISSEDQLTTSDEEALFLAVYEINTGLADDSEAFTLDDVIAAIKDGLEPLPEIEFEQKLLKAGYSDRDDYSDSYWTEGSSFLYEVADGFPRIESSSTPPGINGVSYKLDLNFCKPFLTADSTLLNLLGA